VRGNWTTANKGKIAFHVLPAFGAATVLGQNPETRLHVGSLFTPLEGHCPVSVHFPDGGAERPHVSPVAQHLVGDGLWSAPSRRLRLPALYAFYTILQHHRQAEVRNLGEKRFWICLEVEYQHVSAREVCVNDVLFLEEGQRASELLGAMEPVHRR